MSSKSTGVADVAKRYAAALYDLADERKALDPVAGDLRDLQAALDESVELRRFIASPVISRKAHLGALDAILAKIGAADITRNFLGVVAQNRRLAVLPAIIRAYLDQLAASRGEVTAEVTSAAALSDKQRKSLADTLKKVIGSDVAIDVTVDESLLGGLVVKVGSRMIDGSLRRKLQRLEFAMKGVG